MVQIFDIRMPVPKDNEILIKVVASSVNPIDYVRREGFMKLVTNEKPDWPAGMGLDCSGTVAGLGAKVTGYQLGDRVFACKPESGTFAEYCVVTDDVCALLPADVDFVSGGATPLAALTALQGLRAGNIKKCDAVIISGGAGGVGNLMHRT